MNICEADLFKDRLRLLDSGKWILANYFIFKFEQVFISNSQTQ